MTRVRRIEQVALVGGFLVVVASIAAFDWRLAGILLGAGVILSALDLSRIPGGRRR